MISLDQYKGEKNFFHAVDFKLKTQLLQNILEETKRKFEVNVVPTFNIEIK